MAQALQDVRLIARDDLMSVETDDTGDEIGFVRALRFALPLGLALWALIIWAAIRFLF